MATKQVNPADEVIKQYTKAEYFAEIERQVEWYKNNNNKNIGYAILSIPYGPNSFAGPIYVMYFNSGAFHDKTVNNKLKQGFVVEYVNVPTGLKLNSDEQKDALATLLSRLENKQPRKLNIVEKSEPEIAQEDLKGLKPKK